MLEFFRKFFIAEFDWNWKKRFDFFVFQFVIIFSIFVIISLIFWAYYALDALEFKYCYTWETCFEKEKSLFLKTEIISNILFLMILGFLYKFNTWNILRFSYLNYNRKISQVFEIIFTFLKIFIIWIIFFVIFNFFLIFYSNENYFYFYNIIEKTENILLLIYVLKVLVFIQLVLFLLWLVLPRAKKL